MKRCTRCKAELDLASFSRDAQKKDGLRPECRACHRSARRAYEEANRATKREYDRAYYQENAERIKQRAAAWREQNPDRVAGEHAAMKRAYRVANPERYADYAGNRRALIRDQWVEDVDRSVVWERDGGKCHLCLRPIASISHAHIDHLNPISKGGEHSYGNVALAHAACNLKRGAGRTPAQLRLAG